MSEPCGQPVAFPIRSYKVSGLTSSKRGIALNIGTPPQQVVVGMRPELGSIVVPKAPTADANCPYDITEKRCLWNKGGAFDTSESSSFKGGSKPDAGKDTFTINSDLQLNDLSFTLESKTTGSIHKNPFIGLSAKSDLVNQLFASKNIPSRVYSLDVGRTGRIETDGELLFGGYNKKRLKGAFEDMHEFNVVEEGDEVCPYQITVVRITMIDDKGKRTNLMGDTKSEIMRACLNPTPLITMPLNMFNVINEEVGNIYETETNSNRDWGDVNFWGYTVDESKNFKGSLEFELISGLKVLIPNEQLVTRAREVNDDGEVVPVAKKSTLLIYSLGGGNAKDLPIFGVPFMSSVYMAVDSERRKFWLGNSAVPAGDEYTVLPGSKIASCPTAQDDDDSNNDTETPGSGSTKKPSADSDKDESNDGPNKTANPSNPSSSPSGIGRGNKRAWGVDNKNTTDGNGIKGTDGQKLSGNSTGGPSNSRVPIIAGAVGGAIFLILLISFIIFCLRRRRRQTQNKTQNHEHDSTFSKPEIYAAEPKAGTIIYEAGALDTRYEMSAGWANRSYSHQHGGYLYEAPTLAPAAEMDARLPPSYYSSYELDAVGTPTTTSVTNGCRASNGYPAAGGAMVIQPTPESTMMGSTSAQRTTDTRGRGFITVALEQLGPSNSIHKR